MYVLTKELMLKAENTDSLMRSDCVVLSERYVRIFTQNQNYGKKEWLIVST